MNTRHVHGRDGPPARAHHLFDTDLGTCGVVWDPTDRIVAVALPEPEAADVDDYLRSFDSRRAEPTRTVTAVIDQIVALLAGVDVDLSAVDVAVEDLPEFDRRVYALTRAIGRGEVRTYGQIATDLGAPGAAQAVGRALGRNPIPVVIPCHRVVGAGREVGGFSAPGGASTKKAILAIERVPGFGEPTLF